MAETQNLQLGIYDANTDGKIKYIDYFTSTNSNMTKIDDAYGNLRQDIQNIDVSEQIETHNTSDMAHEDIRNLMGQLSSLTTDDKSNLVGAVNEVKSQSNEMANKLKKDGVILTTLTEQSIPSDIATMKTWTRAVAYKSPNTLFFNINNPTRLMIPPDVKKVRLSTNIVWLYDNNGVGYRQITFLKNGSNFQGGILDIIKAYPSTQYQYISSPIINVSEGDYFEVQLSTTAGVAQTAADGSGGLYGVWFELEVIE